MSNPEFPYKLTKKHVLSWGPDEVKKYVLERLGRLRNILEGNDLLHFDAMKATGRILVHGTTPDFWEQRGISAGTSFELSEISASLEDDPATPVSSPPRLPSTPKRKEKVTDVKAEHPRSSSHNSSSGTSPEPEFWVEAADWVCKIKEQAVAEDWSVATFSNPETHLRIPFPVPGEDIPKAHFQLDREKKFHFMGRTEFSNFYGYIADRSTRTVRLLGTEGIGTSFNLAGLAALLLVEGKRVIYIPDCNEFALNDPIRQFRRALYLAFHDNPTRQRQAANISNEREIKQFFAKHRSKLIAKLVFLVGQCQKIEENDSLYMDNDDYRRKNWFWSLLQDVSFGYQRLFCSSGNHSSFRLAQSKSARGSTEYVNVWKGFGEKELSSWWAYQSTHSKAVEELPLDTRKEIERITGRVPKFMREAIETLPLYVRGIRNTYDIAVEFSHDLKRKYEKTHNEVLHRYYLYLGMCLRGASVQTVDVRALDHRFFRYDTEERKIFAVADFILPAAQRILHQKSIGYIGLENYLSMVSNFKGNPSMIGFAAEGAVISVVYSTGFTYVHGDFSKMTGTTFDEDIPYYDLGILGTRMYVPNKFNYPAIDFLLVHRSNVRNRKTLKKLATIIPVQVSLNYLGHSKSEVAFFKSWREWVNQMNLEKVTVTEIIFVWVTPVPDSSEVIAANSLGFSHPEYTRCLVSFETVSKDLHRVLIEYDAYPIPRQSKPSEISKSNPPAPKKDKSQSSTPDAGASPGGGASGGGGKSGRSGTSRRSVKQSSKGRGTSEVETKAFKSSAQSPPTAQDDASPVDAQGGSSATGTKRKVPTTEPVRSQPKRGKNA